MIAASRGAEIIVADDASTDDSLSFIRRTYPKVRIALGRKRSGFAVNVNRGVAAAHGDIVVLLNTDVEPENDFLPPLTRHFQDGRVFAVGCLEKSYDPGGTVLRGRGEAKWHRGNFVHWRGDPRGSNTAWVSGGSGAFRRDIWNTLGGMDALFSPFYWEDIDLSYRALKAGYRIVFEKRSIIGHYHEEGKIKSEFSSGDVKRVAYRNQFIFIWKNLSDRKQWFFHCLFTPLRLARALLAGDWRMLAGYVWALWRLPSVLVSRSAGSRFWKKQDCEIFQT